MAESSRFEFFKWTCLATAILFGLLLLWMISDFKRKTVAAIQKAETTITKVEQSVEKVNATMPAVLVEIQNTSKTLSRVADDVELMKRVAGVGNNDRGVRGLAIYADELQQVLSDVADHESATILLEELVGSDLKVVENLSEFLVGLNKEMITAILPLSKSREEILYRVSHSGVRRKPFYIQFDGEEPVLLEDFIREHHEASRELPDYQPR